MALLDVGKLVSAGIDAFKNNGNGVPASPYSEIFTQNSDDLFGDNSTSKAFYLVDAKDWYQTYPYRFIVKSKTKDYIYSLPIPPQSLSVSPVIPSQATATLGGVVEESSPVVFWNVSMQGTFGQAISKQDPTRPAGRSDEFRRVFTSGGLLGSALSNLANTAGNVLKAATLNVNPLELLGSTQLPYSQSFVNADTPASKGSIGDAIQSIKNIAGGDSGTRDASQLVTTGGNGFTEVHAFQNFLLAYQKLAGQRPSEFSLYFQSIKDNCQWRCIIASPPSFSKNAQRPFMYDYSISLKCWGLTEVDAKEPPIDRFGPGGDLSDVTSATATGAFTKMSNLAATLKKGLKNPTTLFKIRSVG